MNGTNSSATTLSAGRRVGLTVLTALAVGVSASVGLGAGAAQADPVAVKPGLSCNDFVGVINCTNDTDTDYTVTQKRECAEGDYTDFSYDRATPRMVFHHADAEMKYTNVFVAAHNTGMGYQGCETHADNITYSIAP